MSTIKKVGIAYVPVLHKGYVHYFEKLVGNGVLNLYIVSDEILEAHQELDYINRKDRIRAVGQNTMVKTIEAVSKLKVALLDVSSISELQKEKVEILTPKEDISLFLIDTYFKNHQIEFSDIFLRRNEENVKEDLEPEIDAVVQLTDFQREVFSQIEIEKEKSMDWWRRIGAAIVKDGKVIVVTHNEHLPEPQLSNIYGDLRALYKKGININYVTTAHSEGAAIALMAKEGISTDGAELYVSDFPCPYCARIIVKSGIKKIYFMNGYAVLEGDDLLKKAGIEVVKVKL